MTLKKLLLGSSAVMFAAGAGISTAQAADPNPAGLVVTTMANYVEQCNNGNGWKKKDWCITVAGKMEWTSAYGNFLGTSSSATTFGTDPWNTTVTPAGTEFDINGIPVSYFSLTPTLTLTVSKPTDAGNLTLIYSLGTSGTTATSLTIGPWQFTANQVRYRNTFGPATITATVAEPGRLGWNDPRGTAFDNDWNGPWPDFALDIDVDAGAAEITAGFNVGQRTNDTGIPFLGDGIRFVTVGGYAQGVFGAGPADMTVRFDWDRVNASEDGTGNPVLAWGIMAKAAIDIGAITITPSVGYSHNYGYYGYKYTENERSGPGWGPNYLMLGVAMSAALGDSLTVNAGVEYTRGPDAPDDGVIEITGGVTFKPASASPLYVTLAGRYDNQLGGDDITAIGVTLTVGAAF